MSAPSGDVSAEPDTHKLYRHFSADGELLYLGITSRIPRRIREHENLSHWWQDIARIEIVSFPDRQSAISAERDAIIAEKPKFNVQHKRRPAPIAEPSSSAIISGKNITARIVSLRPLYDVAEARHLLGLSIRQLTKAMDEGKLGWVDLPSPKAVKTIRYITGWQILDWLEAIGGKP